MNLDEGLMNDWWMTDERLMNDWWMTDEWLMNDWWTTDERLMSDWWTTDERLMSDDNWWWLMVNLKVWSRTYVRAYRRTMLVLKSLSRLKNWIYPVKCWQKSTNSTTFPASVSHEVEANIIISTHSISCPLLASFMFIVATCAINGPLSISCV